MKIKFNHDTLHISNTHNLIFSMKNILVNFLIFCVLTGSSAYADGKKYLPLKKTDEQDTKNHTTNDLLKSYMELTSFRHKTLSQNLANVNTPGYKADEVATPKEYGDLTGKGRANRKVRLAKTANHHLDGAQKSTAKFTAHKLEDPYEIKPNGNNVSLAQQMTKVSQNQQDYNAALKGYNATNALVSTALGK